MSRDWAVEGARYLPLVNHTVSLSVLHCYGMHGILRAVTPKGIDIEIAGIKQSFVAGQIVQLVAADPKSTTEL